MGEATKIQWTTHTFNPWRGCSKVSAGCTNCYAETLSKRNPAVLGEWGPNGVRVLASESMWRQPIKWDQKAAYQAEMARKYGWEPPERPRVFCASLADVFEDRPELANWRERLFATIQATPNLDWLLLTKRPENVNAFSSEALGWDVAAHGLPPNVWAGTSVENQDVADLRIPILLRVKAVVRFLSMEPLLGLPDLTRLWLADRSGWWNGLDGRVTVKGIMHGGQVAWLEPEKPLYPAVEWVIVGGESGPKARPCNFYWLRAIIDQCRAASVPVFCKQWGSRPFYDATGGSRYDDHTYHKLGDPKGGDPSEWPVELRVRQFPVPAEAAP